MEYIGTLFLLYLVYSFIGWIIEVVGELIKHKKFVNRGFLIGPYCPIYGFGAIAITLNLTRYYNNLIVLFTMAILICGLLEYFTSFIMEKLFHARWWDYSNMKYNINGRICLETLVPFGILGVLIIQVLNPFFIRILSNIPSFVTIILAILFFIDNIISFKIIFNLKNVTMKLKNGEEDVPEPKDNTEEITKKVKEILKSKSLLHRRLVNAFPKLKSIVERKKKERGNQQ